MLKLSVFRQDADGLEIIGFYLRFAVASHLSVVILAMTFRAFCFVPRHHLIFLDCVAQLEEQSRKIHRS